MAKTLDVIRTRGEYMIERVCQVDMQIHTTASEVIQIVKEAGGYSFLAHPSAYNKGENFH